MKKIAAYMRVGNKEQLELTEQEQKDMMEKTAKKMKCTLMPPITPIPTPEELKAEGYEVITLPKKKAWLYMRSSSGIPDSERNVRMDILQSQAEQRGYEVVGGTVITGASYKSKPAIQGLINKELKEAGADVVFIRGIRDFSFRVAETIEIYDMLAAEGYEVESVDGSAQAFTAETENGMKWRDIFLNMAQGYNAEQIATDEEQDEGQDESPTQTMGGGML